MAKRKKFKCPKCTRTFSMKAHLARHLGAGHGRRRAKTRVSRRARMTVRGRGARLSKAALGLGLNGLSLEQLRELIDSARSEARRRLVDLRSAFM